jgi:non-canonical (house-cleaning) NTP pyrophosphatase
MSFSFRWRLRHGRGFVELHLVISRSRSPHPTKQPIAPGTKHRGRLSKSTKIQPTTTMKLISKGSGQQGWATEATCTGKGNGNGGCGAKLLVEQPDLFETSRTCYTETDYFSTFTCPECGVLTDLDKVPSAIASTLQPRRKETAIKKPVGKRNTPIAIIVAGTSRIKINAVEAARNSKNLHATINGSHDSQSSVNECPLGLAEMITGAFNRAISAWKADPRHEVYVGIENGVEVVDEQFVDFAICGMYIPATSSFLYVCSKYYVVPTVVYEEVKKVGFKVHTVGKAAVDLGLATNHADPHFDFCGVHRGQFLEDAMVELFDRLPAALFTPRRLN